VTREQFNLLTAYLDASHIYGLSLDTSNSLRVSRAANSSQSSSKGELRVSPGFANSAERPYLPLDGGGAFLAGEGRANENMALTSIHTLFLREHNRLARALVALNPQWSDERVFLESRAILQVSCDHFLFDFMSMSIIYIVFV
jgi:hypothetical protein